jgi:hypothetical protein
VSTESRPDPALALDSSKSSGLTLRSLCASLLVITLAGIVGQLAGVFDSANSLIGIEALPVPALLVFWPFLAVAAGVAALARTRIFSRAELVVVLLSALIATPLMTVGFWRYQLAALSTVVRFSDWTKLEALPEGLWPHGANLLQGALRSDAPASALARQGAVSLDGARAKLHNIDANATSSLRLRVDLGSETAPPHGATRAVAVPGRPYLFSARVRASELGPEARYFVRTYADDAPSFAAELVVARSDTKPTPLFPDGSMRVGYYPLELPAQARRSVTFELGLQGEGKVEWQDLRLYDVRAVELGYKGFNRVTRDEYRSLSLAERQSVVVVPDAWLSGAGVHYLLGLDYPLRDWVAPVLRLGGFALLVFAATLSLALLYRKQWLENERYGVPMLRPLLVLLGVEPGQGGLGARFYRNAWLWVGFATAFVWCALKVLHGYVPSLPDLSVSIGLKSYLSDAFWGRTWDEVKLEVYALFFGLALLMELNVLLSLVLGFLAYRLQYWYGQAHGLSSDYNFPHFPHQMLGAYLVYAALTLLFTRRYVLLAVKAAFSARAAGAEARNQRVAILMLLGCGLGFVAWARWVGIPVAAAGLLSLQLVIFGWIAAKLMAECGLPRAGFNHPMGLSGNYNVPVEPLLLVPLLGGTSVFGGNGMMAMTLVTAAVIPYGFFLIPGLQLEALELGRRVGVKSGQVAVVALLAAVAGILIGGWLYLTAAYGFGAGKFFDTAQFGDRLGAFRAFNAELASAQSAMAAPHGGAASSGAAEQAHWWALGFGGVATAVVTLLRQSFSGFWFHPIGLLVGPSDMLQNVWGSLLAAWAVRLTVLRLGGAATVREKLVPAAVGIFFAALLGHALYIALNAYWFFFNKGTVKFGGLL